MGYIMPKDNSNTILLIARGIRGSYQSENGCNGMTEV